ncbi:hypothetical protein OURE66S_00285 [Oligella ureolytica]
MSAIQIEEIKAWLRFSMEPGIGSVTGRELLSKIGLPQLIFDASYSTLESFCPPKLARQLSSAASDEIEARIELTLQWLQSSPLHGILTWPDGYFQGSCLTCMMHRFCFIMLVKLRPSQA